MEKQDLKELKRLLYIYQKLGFSHLPIKKEALRNSKMDEKTLDSLREKIGDCKRCKLYKSRHNIVFGEGSIDADLMLIGEAPGREEDLKGRPFVGSAGALLDRLITKMGFKREELYITNIVKCRPPHNRDPESDEIEACNPFLMEQIEIIEPRVIMTLGRIAAHTLLGVNTSITELRGKVFDFKGIKLVPTFHPAYLIRNPKAKWLTWSDAQLVLKLLDKKL